MNQELCRNHWLECEQQCAEWTDQCNELQYENEALTTKLKHARSASHIRPFFTVLGTYFGFQLHDLSDLTGFAFSYLANLL